MRTWTVVWYLLGYAGVPGEVKSCLRDTLATFGAEISEKPKEEEDNWAQQNQFYKRLFITQSPLFAQLLIGNMKHIQEKGTATHSTILAEGIPWTEEGYSDFSPNC